MYREGRRGRGRVSRIEFIRFKISNFSAHVSGVSDHLSRQQTVAAPARRGGAALISQPRKQ